eukprot:11487289-Alexandrium_andersonii.AAC.1
MCIRDRWRTTSEARERLRAQPQVGREQVARHPRGEELLGRLCCGACKARLGPPAMRPEKA